MRRRTWAGIAAAVVAGALVTGMSIVWPGLDAQETPPADASVWALQTGDGRRYARVNTAVGEIDTVRSVTNPDRVVQNGDAVYVFSDSFSKLTRIDGADPVDLDEEALRSATPTPAGTTDVAVAGDYVAYRTDSGALYAGTLDGGSAVQLDPFRKPDDDTAPQYTSDAVAVDERGMLFSYSAADGSVLRYDIRSGEVRGRDPIDGTGIASPAITAAGDTWAVVDTDDGDLVLRGADAATRAPTTGTVVVGQPDPKGDAVYLAGDAALVRVPVDGSAPATVAGTGTTVLGAPAQPIVHDGVVYAAWLPQGSGDGVLWTSDSQAPTPLDYGGKTLPEERRPAFVEGAGAVILNETRSGWAWTVPSGALVASSQDWSLDDRVNPEAVPSDEQLAVVIDPKPPVAEPDRFGVRPGRLVSLPVLMNDHDPNQDVLSIDPASVTGLDPGFGTVSITDSGQRLAVAVDPGATGTATFQYAVTDGTSAQGLLSPPTTVTLTVAGPGENSPPQWCGVDKCLVEWPTPEVAAGGTITVPVLPGWVDPEGDPLLLLGVENVSGIGSVAASPSGDVVYQHSDDGASAGAETTIELRVTVADTTGATAVKPLEIRVTPQPHLAVQSFTVVDTIDAGLTVDVAPHVTGTEGATTVESVRVLDDAAATATVVGGTTTFDFSAKAAGTFRVDFTVSDGTSEATGTARITILPADAPPQLATAPVVAFVHPQEDATLDVLEAVSNPTRRVLLLSDVKAVPDPGASLSVDAVGQHHLRVSGATASGASGRLGTVSYTISDGTEDQGASIRGEATVYLLPPAPELAPIAVDDTVVVRAGAQIDIPVLDNDIAPAGGRPTLNPASVVSSSPDALAFASGDLLRYLAPETAGDYTVDYSVFTTGAPSLADTATVRIRVLADETNRAPQPETLEGRVLSGQTTLIEFDGFGMDPDGDVVTLDRIVSQPARGAATISADGTSIQYTSVPGDSGQVSFRYRVVDALGASGEGTVRIGVLDEQSNPSPITYTDYVQVQAGAGNTIRVSPLANDVDPTMGRLSLTRVRPDTAETLADGSQSPEFTRLSGQIRSTDDTTVVIAAGDAPGTMSFLYDVESSSGNTGRGLIVVKVVRESVPDYPVVADTVLTAETRQRFPAGVDVLSGKAQWSGGDVSDLKLSLWGDPSDARVTGRSIVGALPAHTRVIPFAVTGEGASGEVTTYAFLRVPGDDDLSLALKAGAAAPQVEELKSVAFDMGDLVAKPRGTRLQVGDDVRASGARAAATCALTSGDTVTYTAGAGAPWADACQVPVRLQGQSDWTYLTVPVVVTPLAPQPDLRPASVTVGPGETATFDLRDMTTWQLRADWEHIAYQVEYTGTSFQVTQAGSVVTVVGADRAVPGAEEAAIVSVTSHTGVAPARLILRVGAAPSTLPQGGSVVQQCSEAAGSSCTIKVVGGSGEVNPLPRTPLEVVDIRPVGACTGVSFAVASASSVTASWTTDAPGATCAATFSVRDAQGRRTNAERDGRLLLDLQGFPQAPASVVQTAYASGSLTLRVDPGSARLAYPALTGFVVRYNGDAVAQCDADGVCPPISAPNGEQRTYEAWAVNAVGESHTAVRTTAWAYDAPPAPSSVTSAPVPTSGGGGIVSLRIDGIDPSSTGSLLITSPLGESSTVQVGPGRDHVAVASYRVGSNTASPITVTPQSRFPLPPGLGGSVAGPSTTVLGNGVGAATDVALALQSQAVDAQTSTVTAQASATLNGDGALLRYGIVRVVNGATRCTTTDDGAAATFTGLRGGETYDFMVCVDTVYDGTVFNTVTARASVDARQPENAPRGWTFLVGATPNVQGQRAEWTITAQPDSSVEDPPNRNHAEFSGWPGSTVFGRDPGIQVRYVHDRWGTATQWAPVTARASGAPYQVQANWSVAACVGGSDLSAQGDSSSAPSGAKAAIGFDPSGMRFFDADHRLLPRASADSWTVPVGAVSVEGIGVTVDWTAMGWGLSTARATFSGQCVPNYPPAPDPTPTSTSTPTP